MGTDRGRDRPSHQAVGPRSTEVVLLNSQGLVLSVSRKTDPTDLGLPGGKVEEGETYAEAAIRETLEEIGVRVIKMRPVFDCRCGVYQSRTFLVEEWEGEPASLEGAAVAWVPIERLLEPDNTFCEYNRKLFSRLKMI